MVVRGDPDRATRLIARLRETNPGLNRAIVISSVDAITVHFWAFIPCGFGRFVVHEPTPYDAETLERFVTAVRPDLN
jgi:hypothetical protein